MKRIILGFVLSSLITSSYANFTQSGFYRVKNYGSGRWAAMVDNKGDVDFVAGSADLHALSLTKDTEAILSDPGSIVYITKLTGTQYDLAAQGTSFQALVNHPINIGQDGSADGQALYRMYGSYSGVTRYIADGNIGNEVKGYATINEMHNTNYMKWMILPVDAASDNYFGTVPTVYAGGKSYTTVFTSFAYKPYSEGVKAFYINRVGFGMAEMIEITDAVPPGSPVIIQCAGTKVSDNRFQLLESQDALPSNALSGAYFNYKYNTTVNQVVYNPETMRVLGLCSDGSLGFVTADIESIPANTAYLVVPAGSSPEFKCVSTSDYEAGIPTAPDMIFYNESMQLLPQDEYNYTGTITVPANDGTNKNVGIQFYTQSGNSKTVLGPDAYGNVNLKLSTEMSVPFAYGSNYSWVLQNWEGGEVTVTVNLLYQYVKFYAKSAAVGSIISSNKGLYYSGNVVTSDNNAEIRIMNLSGQTVMQSSGGPLDVSSLPKGIYIAVSEGTSLKIVR